MAANWCSGAWRAWLARAGRSRASAVVLSGVIAVASARCIADFLVTPKTPSKTGSPGAGPPGAPPAEPRLMFVVQPSGGAPGYPLDTVAVAAVDSAGHPANPTVALELIGAPAGATLGGSRQRAANGGVAAFGDLVVDSAGSFRLVALATGFVPDTSQSFSILVPPVDRVDVSPGKADFNALGASVQLAAQARDAASRPVAGARIGWSTSDSTVASVSGSGVVTARGNGTATIRASSGNASASVAVTVSQAVGAVAVSPSDVSLEDGESTIVTASAADSRGNALQRPVQFTWHSNRTRTATVTVDPSNSARALVRRVSDHGGATITATTEGVSGTVSIH